MRKQKKLKTDFFSEVRFDFHAFVLSWWGTFQIFRVIDFVNSISASTWATVVVASVTYVTTRFIQVQRTSPSAATQRTDPESVMCDIWEREIVKAIGLSWNYPNAPIWKSHKSTASLILKKTTPDLSLSM